MHVSWYCNKVILLCLYSLAESAAHKTVCTRWRCTQQLRHVYSIDEQGYLLFAHAEQGVRQV